MKLIECEISLYINTNHIKLSVSLSCLQWTRRRLSKELTASVKQNGLDNKATIRPANKEKAHNQRTHAVCKASARGFEVDASENDGTHHFLRLNGL